MTDQNTTTAPPPQPGLPGIADAPAQAAPAPTFAPPPPMPARPVTQPGNPPAREPEINDAVVGAVLKHLGFTTPEHARQAAEALRKVEAEKPDAKLARELEAARKAQAEIEARYRAAEAEAQAKAESLAAENATLKAERFGLWLDSTVRTMADAIDILPDPNARRLFKTLFETHLLPPAEGKTAPRFIDGDFVFEPAGDWKQKDFEALAEGLKAHVRKAYPFLINPTRAGGAGTGLPFAGAAPPPSAASGPRTPQQRAVDLLFRQAFPENGSPGARPA